MALKPITKKQGRITVSGAGNALWSAAKNPGMERDTATYTDTDGMTKTVVGLVKAKDLTLSKIYDPAADGNLVKWLRGQADKPTNFSVSVQGVNADAAGSKLGGTFTYPNCVMLSFTDPEYDSEGSGVVMIEMIVAVNSRPTYN